MENRCKKCEHRDKLNAFGSLLARTQLTEKIEKGQGCENWENCDEISKTIIIVFGNSFELKKAKYDNERTALVLIDKYGRVETKLTVNISNVNLAPDEVIIKNYGENLEIAEELLKFDVFKDTKRTADFGIVTNQPIFKVDLTHVREF